MQGGGKKYNLKHVGEVECYFSRCELYESVYGDLPRSAAHGSKALHFLIAHKSEMRCKWAVAEGAERGVFCVSSAVSEAISETAR